MIVYMIRVWWLGERYKVKFTVEGMNAARSAQNQPSEMTEEEIQKCVDLLEGAFNSWDVVERTDDGGEIRKPTKMKQIKASVLEIDQAIAMNPNEPDLVERLNELTDVVNSNEKRFFYGSKPLVILGLLFSVFVFFVSQWQLALGFLVSTGAYILASRTPAFLIEKRANRGGGNVHSRLIAGVFAMIAAAKTVRTVTTYADGHKETEDDNTETWMSMIIGFAFLVVLASVMALWAIINFFRNYVFYI